MEPGHLDLVLRGVPGRPDFFMPLPTHQIIFNDFTEWSLTCWGEKRREQDQWPRIGLTSAATSSPLSSTSWSLPSQPPPPSPHHPLPPSPPLHHRRRHRSSVPSGLWSSRLRREWATVLSRIWNPLGSSSQDLNSKLWNMFCNLPYFQIPL